MPTRILRNWIDSSRLANIPAEVERLFIRIIMTADDYGRVAGDAERLRGTCYLLQNSVKVSHVATWLADLVARNLVVVYRVGDRDYAAIRNFRQRPRGAIPKCPPPSLMDTTWLPEDENFRDSHPEQPAATCGSLLPMENNPTTPSCNPPQPAATPKPPPKHFAATCGNKRP